MKEKKARVEDALHATRAAVEEGIVPGGGVALIRAAAALEKLNVPDDERFGVNIVRRAIEEPLRWIAKNAGAEGSIVLDKVRSGKGAFGFNAAGGGVRGPAEGGHHRSDQGRPHRAAERSVGGEPDAHHRGHGGREARGEVGGAGHASGRHGRNGGHGRHDVTPVPALIRACRRGTRAASPGCPFFRQFLDSPADLQ